MREEIVRIAKANGADLVGFAPASRFDEDDPIFKIFPGTKTVIGLAFRVLRGIYRGVEEGTTYYQYTTMGVENMEETVMPMAQLKVAMYMEQQGAIALPQRRHQQIMAEANSNSACSLYAVEEGQKHVVIFPEEEKPRTLQRHFWGKPFQGSMEPQFEFTAIIQAVPGDGSRHRYKGLLDFAWRYYGHPLKAPRKAEELHRLSIAFGRYLFQRERNGFAAFTGGAQWHIGVTGYKKQEHRSWLDVL